MWFPAGTQNGDLQVYNGCPYIAKDSTHCDCCGKPRPSCPNQEVIECPPDSGIYLAKLPAFHASFRILHQIRIDAVNPVYVNQPLYAPEIDLTVAPPVGAIDQENAEVPYVSNDPAAGVCIGKIFKNTPDGAPWLAEGDKGIGCVWVELCCACCGEPTNYPPACDGEKRESAESK